MPRRFTRKESLPTLAQVKADAKDSVARVIAEAIRPIIEAQMARARGTKYLAMRSKKTGQWVPVTESQLRKIGKAGSEEVLEVWSREPSTEAAKVLLDRLLDAVPKPPEEIESGPREMVIRWAKPGELDEE